MNLEYIVAAGSALVLAIFGFMMRRNAKLHDEAKTHFEKHVIRLERDLEHFERRLRQAMSRSEVRELLDDKLEPIHVLLKEIKEDIKEARRD
jgi:hypothetical protein